MLLPYVKNTKYPVLKPCLECKKYVNTEVHTCRSFKGYLMHIRCADNLFSTLFLISPLAKERTLKKRFKERLKIHRCLICNKPASGANGFKHSIVYEGHHIELKIHRTCFFNRYGLDYNQETKRAISS
jgi:hypothetical protein